MKRSALQTTTIRLAEIDRENIERIIRSGRASSINSAVRVAVAAEADRCLAERLRERERRHATESGITPAAGVLTGR